MSHEEDERPHQELIVGNHQHRELMVRNNEELQSDGEEERPHRELIVANNEELETHLKNILPWFFHEEGTKYSLTVRFPISNEDFSKLAISPLGQFLEELVIQIIPSVKYTAYPSLYPENLTSESKFPKLKKLELEGQPISAVHFVSEVFPVLEDLSISHVGCVSFHLNLPTIRFLDFQYFMVGGDGYDDFDASLNRSPKLEGFTSYKFILLADEYVLILPNCRLLSFYRSDCLSRLSLFAPKLETLNLQACYGIDQVNLLTEVPDWMKRGDKDDSYQFSTPDVTGPEYSVSGPL